MLNTVRSEPPNSWLFEDLFVRVFDRNHLSLQCIGMSLGFSTLAFVTVSVTTGVLSFDLVPIEGISTFGVVRAQTLLLVAFGSLAILFNGLVDYLSLWKSRWIIGSSIPILYKLLLDAVATYVLATSALSLIALLVFYVGFSQGLEWAVQSTHEGSAELAASGLLVLLAAYESLTDFPPQYGNFNFVVVATSFFTLVWQVLHVTAALG